MWFLGKGLPGSGHSGCKGPREECAGRAEEQQGVLCGWGRGEKREGDRERNKREDRVRSCRPWLAIVALV